MLSDHELIMNYFAEAQKSSVIFIFYAIWNYY